MFSLTAQLKDGSMGLLQQIISVLSVYFLYNLSFATLYIVIYVFFLEIQCQCFFFFSFLCQFSESF